ncbi:mannan endo-1,4-beta-mannosidase 5-like [Canna indica]|uniref:Mannan endo-1,4-beta-mannosidase 5-like n=1 Tax=Canna indica TaxID=4628 RepID=A0AAQ3K8P8_9LILI|nr:mannan endo-1,4-beta-mannosidase 5-like [Canna indica]
MAKFASTLYFILVALTLLSIFVPGCRSTNTFVGRRGTQFVLDGSPFLFNGFNAYWMMHVAAEPAQRGKVSVVLRQAAAARLIVDTDVPIVGAGVEQVASGNEGVHMAVLADEGANKAGGSGGEVREVDGLAEEEAPSEGPMVSECRRWNYGRARRSEE